MATVRDLVRVAVRAAGEKKGQEIKALDVRGISSVTDYMVIATGSSDTNVRAIAEAVREKLAARGEKPLSLEGMQEGTWVLLDYVDFVVHVFHAEQRIYFALEELWADAKPVAIAQAPARRAAARPARKPATGAGAKEPLPQVPRAALKPAAKRSPISKPGATKTPAPKKASVPKRKAGG